MSSDINEDKFVRCSWRAVLDNTSKNAFILMGSMSNAAMTIVDFPGPDSDSIYAQSLYIGEDFGVWVRVALGFTYAE